MQKLLMKLSVTSAMAAKTVAVGELFRADLSSGQVKGHRPTSLLMKINKTRQILVLHAPNVGLKKKAEQLPSGNLTQLLKIAI